MPSPTAFISYSWESDEHRKWVNRFAADLRDSGVIVLLDQWAVRLGDDVTTFMEQGLKNADFVLLVCTEDFAGKAMSRTKGVGYEQTIVTAALLNDHPVRGRFVCVLRSGAPSSAIPLYMQTRLWLDLRDERTYGEGLKQLLLHLLERRHTSEGPVELSHSTSVGILPPLPVPAIPDRWILVAGSGVERAFSEELASISAYLGRRLAERNCGLVTGGWFGVDETTARAFAESDAIRSGTAALEDRLIQVIPTSKEPAFAAGQLVFVESGEREWTEAISRSTSVFLLGGVGGTRKTGEIALRMGKLVLPLADTGGDAKQFYLHMLKTWRNSPLPAVDQRTFQRLARPGKAGVDAALDIAIATPHAV